MCSKRFGVRCGSWRAWTGVCERVGKGTGRTGEARGLGRMCSWWVQWNMLILGKDPIAEPCFHHKHRIRRIKNIGNESNG